MIRLRMNYVIVAILASIVGPPLAVCGVPVRIRPLHTTAHFSKSPSAKPWSADVLGVDGKPAYKLSLEAEHGPKDVVISLFLALADARDEGGYADSNLLNPHNWHGLQPCHFVGRDLAQGADKSAFGARRQLTLKSKRLLVRIEILEAKVSPLPSGDYQINHLELVLTVDNLP